MPSRARLPGFFVCALIAVLLIINQFPQPIPRAYAHFFGGTTVNLSHGYQVTFVPVPSTPAVGDKSTHLNFSVLSNNSDIYDVFVSLIVTKSGTGDQVANIPYKPYVFSDVSIPIVFNDTGSYNVTIYTLMPRDPMYNSAPLYASFNLPVISPIQAALSNSGVLFVIILVPVAAGAAATSFYFWKKSDRQ